LKLAIIGGIANYKSQTVLSACQNDAATFKKFLDATNSYADICFLGPDTAGQEAKKIIADFVQKHRNAKIDELVFYFSGHGDRTEDDFFYAMSDYKSDRKETTGLRNTELDALIRNLAPELTIKIVDACYSGSTYIKADDDISPVIQKSAKDNHLKKLYFLYSSESNETSWAGADFSYFTLALFKSLTEQIGFVRYRDLIAAIADEMHKIGAPKPTFVVQADNLETFVEMNASLSDLLKAEIGISDSGSTGSNSKLSDLSQDIEGHSKIEHISPDQLTLAELAERTALEIFCTEAEATQSLRLIEDALDSKNWPDEITNAFNIEVSHLEERSVPNNAAIGKWIQSQADDPVFAVPRFETQTYVVNEYQEVPRKPSAKIGTFGISSIGALQKLFGEDKEYRLEKVQREREIVSGFKYTVDPVIEPRELLFRPLHASLEQYSANIVFLFSRRSLTCLYSIEHLRYIGWEKTVRPSAAKWKQLSAPLKSQEKILGLVRILIDQISDVIILDARQQLI